MGRSRRGHQSGSGCFPCCCCCCEASLKCVLVAAIAIGVVYYVLGSAEEAAGPVKGQKKG